MTIPAQLILAIGGVIALSVILIKLGRQIAIFLLVAGVIAGVLVIGLVLLGQAKATQQVAEAAAVASTGQTATSVSTIVLATLLAVALVTIVLGFAYMNWRLQRAQRRAARQPRRWRPGPNARWGQHGRSQAHIVPPAPAGRYLAPPPAYPPAYYAYPPMGYAPPHGYPGGGAEPVVVIYDEGATTAPAEDPLDLLPLWAEDDEMEGW
jgi:hypothetical protein